MLGLSNRRSAAFPRELRPELTVGLCRVTPLKVESALLGEQMGGTAEVWSFVPLGMKGFYFFVKNI